MNLKRSILLLSLIAGLHAFSLPFSKTPATPRTEQTLQAVNIDKLIEEKVTTLPRENHVIQITPEQEMAIKKLFAKKQTRGAVFQTGIKPADKIKPLEELVTKMATTTSFNKIKLQHQNSAHDIVIESFFYSLQVYKNGRPSGRSERHLYLKTYFCSDKRAPHWANLFEALRHKDPFFTASGCKKALFIVAGAATAGLTYLHVEPIIKEQERIRKELKRIEKIDTFAQELAAELSQRKDLFPSSNPTAFVGKADITDTWGTPTTNTTLDVSGPGKADIVVVSALSSEGKRHFFSSQECKKDTQAEQVKVLVVANSDFYPFSTTEIRTLNTYGWTCVRVNNNSTDRYYYHSDPYYSSSSSGFFIDATTDTSAQSIARQITDKRKPYLKGLGLTVEASEDDYQQRAVKFSGADAANPAHNEALIEIRRNLARYASPDAVKMAFEEKAGAIQARMAREAVLAEEKRRKDAAAQAAALKAANIERCKNYVVPVMDFLQEHTVALFNSPQPTGSGAGEGTTSTNDNRVTVNRQFAAKPDDEHGYVVDFSALNAGEVNQVLIIGAPFPGTIDHLRTTGILEADKKLQQIKIIVIPLTTLNQEEITPDLQAIFMNYKWHVIFVNDDQKTFNDMFPVSRNWWSGNTVINASTWNTLIEKNNQWFKGFVWMNTDRSTDPSWHIFTGHNWSPSFRRIHIGREYDSPIADTRDTVFPLLDDCTVDSFPNDLAAAVERRLTSAQPSRLSLWSRGRQTSREDTASLNRLRRASAHSRRKLFHTQHQFEQAEELLLMERCKKIARTSPEEYLGLRRGSNPSRHDVDSAYRVAKDRHSGPTAEGDSSSTPPPNELLLLVDLAYKILTDDEYYKFIYGKTKAKIEAERAAKEAEIARQNARHLAAHLETQRLAREAAEREALYQKHPHLRPRLMMIPA